jgi:hypothetical protein
MKRQGLNDSNHVGDELVDTVLEANRPNRDLVGRHAGRPKRTVRCGDCTALAPNKKASKNLKKVPVPIILWSESESPYDHTL